MSPRCPRSIFHPVPLEDRYLVYLKYHNDLDFNVVDLDLCPISYFILILINPFLFFSLRLKRFSSSRLPASRLLASVFGSFFGCRLDWIGCAIYNGRCCRLWVSINWLSHCSRLFPTLLRNLAIDFDFPLCLTSCRSSILHIPPIPRAWNPSPVIDTLPFPRVLLICMWQSLGSILYLHTDAWQLPFFELKMANQCSGHVFAIVQATNGNILTWRCSDCNSGPFVAIWRCKACGHCRCNACHNAKGCECFFSIPSPFPKIGNTDFPKETSASALWQLKEWSTPLHEPGVRVVSTQSPNRPNPLGLGSHLDVLPAFDLASVCDSKSPKSYWCIAFSIWRSFRLFFPFCFSHLFRIGLLVLGSGLFLVWTGHVFYLCFLTEKRNYLAFLPNKINLHYASCASLLRTLHSFQVFWGSHAPKECRSRNELILTPSSPLSGWRWRCRSENWR